MLLRAALEEEKALRMTAEVALEEERAKRRTADVALEEVRAKRRTAEVALEEKRAMRMTAEARAHLFDPGRFSSLQDWLEVHDVSNIPHIQEEEQYLLSYKTSSSNDNSINFQEDSSSTTSIWADSTIPMHCFRRKMTNSLPSKMQLRMLELNDAAITKLVCERALGGDLPRTDRLVSDLSIAVKKIRTALFFREEMCGIKCPELTVVQPLFMLLMEHMMSLVLPDGRGVVGQSIMLQGTVLVEASRAPKSLSGYANLLLYKGESADGPLDQLQCVCELKRPFKKLSHGGAHASKEQLLAELEGCGQMTGNARHIVGLLSDFFVAGVAIRAPPMAPQEYPIFYQASRVTATPSFVLRLLFVLLDLGERDYADLLLDCTSEVEVPDDDAVETSEGGSTEVTTAAAAEPHSRARADGRLPSGSLPDAAKGPGMRGKMLSCPKYRAAVREEEIQMVIERDYERRGLAYLSADELNRRNFTARPATAVERDILSLL